MIDGVTMKKLDRPKMVRTIKYQMYRKKRYQIIQRDFTQKELYGYFGDIGITLPVLNKFLIQAVDVLYEVKDDDTFTVLWSYRTPKDVCYAYYFGVKKEENIDYYQWEFYFPLRTRDVKNRRFLITTSLKIGWVSPSWIAYRGLVNVYTQFCIITKAVKEALLIESQEIHLFGERLYAYPALRESSSDFSDEDVLMLYAHHKYVLVWFDFDRGGLPSAFALRHKYGFIPIFIRKKDYGAKDGCDFYALHGRTGLLKLVTKLENFLTNLNKNKYGIRVYNKKYTCSQKRT